MPRCAKKVWEDWMYWCSLCGRYRKVRREAPSTGTHNGAMYRLVGRVCGHEITMILTVEGYKDLMERGLTR